MKHKLIIMTAVAAAVFGLALTPASVVAEEHTGTAEQTDNGGVEINIGQSLDIAIDSTTAEVGRQVSEAARAQKLGQASSQNQRARVLAEDLNETVQESQAIRSEYETAVDTYETGDMSKQELVTEVAKLSTRAEQVERELSNIGYSTQFIPEDELNNTGVTQDKIQNSRNEVDVVGGQVATEAKNASLNPGSTVSLDAQQKGLSVSVQARNGRSYEGRDRETPDHGEFNVTEEDAVQVLADEFGFDQTNYTVETERDDDGYYEVEAENETVGYEAEIDGRNGEIISSEREEDERGLRTGARGPPDRGENGDDKRGPPEESSDRSERGENASETRGPPAWAQNDDEKEREAEDDEERSEPEQEENATELDEPEEEYEGVVTAISTDEENITLDGGSVVDVSQATVEEGDAGSLIEAKSFVQNFTVEVEGQIGDQANDSNSTYVAATVKYEIDDADRNDDTNGTEQQDDEADETERRDYQSNETEPRDEEANETEPRDDDTNETTASEDSSVNKSEAVAIAFSSSEAMGEYSQANFNVSTIQEDGDYVIVARNDDGSHESVVESESGDVEDYEFTPAGGE